MLLLVFILLVAVWLTERTDCVIVGNRVAVAVGSAAWIVLPDRVQFTDPFKAEQTWTHLIVSWTWYNGFECFSHTLDGKDLYRSLNQPDTTTLAQPMAWFWGHLSADWWQWEEEFGKHCISVSPSLSGPSGLSLTPVQNKYGEAAQVWDENRGDVTTGPVPFPKLQG